MKIKKNLKKEVSNSRYVVKKINVETREKKTTLINRNTTYKDSIFGMITVFKSGKE